jgi:hypothetical protein
MVEMLLSVLDDKDGMEDGGVASKLKDLGVKRR